MEYGSINDHLIGIVMKETVRRAIDVIRRERFVFEAQEKENIHTSDQDFVTSADKAAQAIYLKSIRECFPEFGIIAEEDEMQIPCTHPTDDIYFTIDPLDGTKAFIRRQSHGIGTMLGLVCNGEVIAACVGDIMTQEIYYFRPGSQKVHRVSEYNTSELLGIDKKRPLSDQYILLRDDPRLYSPLIEQLTAPTARVFKSLEVGGGSIGIAAARLWKGELGVMVLRPGSESPWDLAPMIGISKKMGFISTAIKNGVLVPRDLLIKKDFQDRPEEIFILHESRFDEFHDVVKLFLGTPASGVSGFAKSF